MRPSLFLLSVATGIRIMYCENDCLRDYQQEMKLRLFEEWELHRSVMVQMPTGTGKTHLLAAIVREFLCGSGSRVWIVAHRRELVEQIEETVSRYGMGREDGSVRVMSIQWLSRNRKIVNGQPDLIVIDEAHHALAETYRELWKSYPEARKLGMTATPCRLNRKGFTDLFDTLITSWSIAEFIGRGWLSSFDYVSIRANSREQRLVDSLKKLLSTAGPPLWNARNWWRISGGERSACWSMWIFFPKGLTVPMWSSCSWHVPRFRWRNTCNRWAGGCGSRIIRNHVC